MIFLLPDDMGRTLENYVRYVFPADVVRVWRSNVTLGLIRARLLGIRMARGEVVFCTDSHVEVQSGW